MFNWQKKKIRNRHQQYTQAKTQCVALKIRKHCHFIKLPEVYLLLNLFLKLFLLLLLCLIIIFLSDSAGPQKCASCIQEGIYEEGISILETSSVRKNTLKET